jgi:hypothetical protein
MIKALKDILFFPVFIISLLGVLFLGLDQVCVVDANRRLPPYPGTTRIKESHNGLRARGLGNSLEVFLSQDNPEVIEAWYQQLALDLLKGGKNQGIAALRHWFEADPTNEGIYIYNLSQCVM